MSNIQTTIDFLKQFPDKHFITITNTENSNPVGQSKIFIKDIPNEDLKNYIKFQLGAITKPTLVWVELRRENGTSSQKKGACGIQVSPDFVQELAAPVVQNLQVSAPTVHEASPMNNSMLGNSFGLGFHEVMKMNTDSAMLIEVRKQLDDAKEEIKELKHNNRKLDLDLIEQKTKVATAEQQKELAVMLATAGQKGFFDGEGFQKLLEKAPDMLEKIAAMKAGNSEGVSTLGNPSYNAAQKEFIDYVVENCSDEQIKGLIGICFYIKNPEFQAELTELINKYKV
ncbi:hypothetical protein [Flavobacterium sp.]|uniref:hypothetical protein n=1 Tax=Flavobacterium sp. TaxID=239 RepID=UPI00391D9001